ncbi:DUF6019 family protein [Desulfitobacterium metallireducens]|nr:DUF6019 family protein [Desulfitobacterium metallireducens]
MRLVGVALFPILLWAIGLVVFYFIIKTAVKNGIAEAHQN